MSLESLWGELPDTTGLSTPVTILREQALLLTEMTNRVLEGVVGVWKGRSTGVLVADLDIIAPVLDNYQVSIVRIKHDVQLYPVNLQNMLSGRTYEATNEDEFINALRDMLTSPEVRRAITGLLVQSRPTEMAKVDPSGIPF